MLNDFRNFVSRGNVLDLAVAVVMGSTFGAIVTSLVNDLMMPAVRLVTLRLNFSNLALRVGDIQIAYGNFLQSVVTFLLVAWVSFWLVRMVKRMQLQLLGAQAAGVESGAETKAKDLEEDIALLREIRDLLKMRVDTAHGAE